MALRSLLAVLLAAGVMGFAPAPPPRPDRSSRGLTVKNLQGEWSMVRYERNGSSLGITKLKVRINDNKWAFFQSTAPAKATASYILSIDPGKKPVWLDLARDNTNPKFQTFRLQGIAKLEGDTLTLSFTTSTDSNQRPTKFHSAGSKVGYLLVLKRDKP